MEYTIVTTWNKPRTNSKKWRVSEPPYIVPGIPKLVDEPKLRTTHKVLTDCPDLTIPEIWAVWELIDICMTPVFFCNSARLGISWPVLLRETEKKRKGESNYASVQLNPLAQDINQQDAV